MWKQENSSRGGRDFVTCISPVLKDLRQNNQLCDGTIQTEDGSTFIIHRAMISAVSPYFRALYTSTLSSNDVRDITIGGISSEVMAAILDFAYSGSLAISEATVEELLAATDQMLIIEAIQQCEKFLEKKLNCENCVFIYCISQRYYCPTLSSHARKYILANFIQVFLYNRELHLLPAGDLQSLLKDDRLNIEKEEMAFQTALCWLQYSPEEREHQFPDMLAAVRFGLCSLRYLKNIVLNCKYVKRHPASHANIAAVVTHLSAVTGSEEGLPLCAHNYQLRPRLPHSVLFVVGGWSSGSATSIIETYDIRAKRWFISSYNDSLPRAYHGLVTLNNLIYLVGGFDGQNCFGSLRCFNPITHEWSDRACMYFSRCYVSAVELQGLIYALGGYDGRTRTNTCERYDPRHNQWTLLPSMNEQRSDASAAPCNGKVFVAGGFNGLEVLSSVEVFNPRTNSWMLIASMLSPRSGVSLVTYRGCLYVVGGFDGLMRLDTMERYDRNLDRWIEMRPMSVARSNFATCVMEGVLFVIGGYNGVTTVADVESYDDEDGTWKSEISMNVNRSALGSCVITGLPNTEEYTFLDAA